jgi:hypothetical protein
VRSRPFLTPVLMALMIAPTVAAQTRPLSRDLQIRLAVQAGAPALRDSATVQGYDGSGAFVTLRKGTNKLICMAPNPKSEQFEVSCHQADLEPFFARGRELMAQGVTGQARNRARWDDITAGKFKMPIGAVNSILTGSGFDSATGEIRDPYLRWVIYVPGATQATTGLPARPMEPGGPWLMFPGTPGAHIMISPPGGRR